MIKLGLTQRVDFLADRGERRDCLDQQWPRLLLTQGIVPVPLPNCVENAELYVEELGLGGIILTGGNDLSHLPGATNTAPERDAFERRLLALARERELPLFGVCRGMQMMVAESGGELVAVRGHVARPHALAGGPARRALGDRDLVNSFHDFGVREDGLGGDWRVLATAPDGSVEAIVHRRHPQCAVMWHPERAPEDPRDARLIRDLFTRGRLPAAAGGGS